MRPAGKLEPASTSHDADIYFAFVLEGGVTLSARDGGPRALEAGDAYVIPPGLATQLSQPSPDLELLEVTLPAQFVTDIAQ